MKSNIIEHSGKSYYVEIKQDKKITSNKNHFAALYEVGSKSPLAGQYIKPVKNVNSAAVQMVFDYLLNNLTS